MKKYFIIAIAAITALAACSKNEVNDSRPDSPIRFSVVNHLQRTKATAGLEYPKGVPFGTHAWWTQNNWTGAAADQTYVFMDNQKVAYSNNEWAPTQAFYWTKTGYLTFASYSPYTESGADNGYSVVPTYDVAKGFLFTNYTIVDDTNVDLMYSNLAADCTKDTNVNGAEVTDDTTPEGGFKGVPTIFNHALCQIGFAFRAIGRKNPNVDDIKIVIKDVDIVNINKKGSFTQTPASGAKWESDHSMAANLASYDYAPASPIELSLIDNTATNVGATDNYTALATTRILLPQSLEDDDDPTDPSVDPIASTTDQKLVVSYTIKIKYASAAEWATEEAVSAVRLNNGTISSWQDNQRITYRISINPYNTLPITFDPAVVDWTDVYSSDINLNQFDN